MFRLIKNVSSLKNKSLMKSSTIIKKQVLNFDDTRSAYISKTSVDLIRSLFVLKLCGYQKLVNNNKIILKWMEKLFGRRFFEYFMKMTFYGQFVAGENDESVERVIKMNRKYGVKSILDYSVEEDVSELDNTCITKLSINKAIIPLPNEHMLYMKYQPLLKFGDGAKNTSSARKNFYLFEDQCDRHLDVTLKSIETIEKLTNPTEAFVAIKISALGRPQLLFHLSEMLNSMEKLFHLIVDQEKTIDDEVACCFRTFDFDSFRKSLVHFGVEASYDDLTNWFALLDTNKDKVVDLFEWSNLIYFERNLANLFKIKNKGTGERTPVVSSLTEEGVESMRLMLQRLNIIAEFAKEKKIRVIIDAEQSYFQPAIRRLSLEMMKKFNKESRLIHNSYQCYLKNALEQVISDLHFSKTQSFKIGLKLVRGAYLEQERERALIKGYPDPILPDFDATSRMYNSCVDAVFNEVKARNIGEVGVMVATHNEDTINYTLAKMRDMNILPNARVTCFGQLLGMSDHLTFILGQNEYSVYKVVPYGPINDVLPYLSRRATENRSIFQKVKRQKDLLQKELWRRASSPFRKDNY